ncbi:MAG: flavodoxin domain-containing protein [Lachnospiraceae bacterium]|nr:flavodoxin domain-containing protein [Lachnospiraceae bacterium]
MGKKMTEHVEWTGKIDWELKTFHGHELSTHRGSSYNSYLVKGEKTALLDTVWGPYRKEFVDNLQVSPGLDKIDYVIMNHNEPDHSGSLPELMKKIPDVPVYCTANGEKIIRGEYHLDLNFHVVKTGDTLDLGDGVVLTFIEAPMLHWPDTMFTYLNADGGILFSNDGFGQHLAANELYADTADESELYYEAMKYYANILNTYSPMVTAKIKAILGMNLPLSIIAPSHGLIWRKDPQQIVNKYLEWADAYQEDRITVIYDTMWNSTRRMAECISEGIGEASPGTTVKVMDASVADKNDILTEIFRSKAIVVGSPTINNTVSYAIAGLLDMAKGLKFKKKKAAAFGSYGWSGEGCKVVTGFLKEAGFDVVNDGIRVMWAPDQAALDSCTEFGREFVKAL